MPGGALSAGRKSVAVNSVALTRRFTRALLPESEPKRRPLQAGTTCYHGLRAAAVIRCCQGSRAGCRAHESLIGWPKSHLDKVHPGLNYTASAICRGSATIRNDLKSAAAWPQRTAT